MRRSIFLSLFVCLSAPVVQAQVQAVADASGAAPAITVTVPAPLPAGVTATVDIVAGSCAAPVGSSLVKAGIDKTTTVAGNLSVLLTAPLPAGSPVCATVSYAANAGVLPAPVLPANISTPAVVALMPVAPPAPPVPATLPVIEPITKPGQYIVVDPVPLAAGQSATIDVSSCTVPAAPAAPALATPAAPAATAPATPAAPTSAAPATTPAIAAASKTGNPKTGAAKQTKPTAKTTTAAPAPAVPAPAPAPAAASPVPAAPTSSLLSTGQVTAVNANAQPITLQLAKAASAGDTLCAVETFANPVDSRISKPATVPSVAPPALKSDTAINTPITPSGALEISRFIMGVDVSGASSTDPSAKFMLDASVDLPLAWKSKKETGASRDIDAYSWLWGYARLSSIAQPGSVNGLSNPTNYVSGLTSQSPNNIVQSFELTAGYAFRLLSFDLDNSGPRDNTGSGGVSSPILVSFIADAGLITPVSDAQTGTPTIYIATSALESYYTGLAKTNPSGVNTTNATNITAACITGSPATCYVVQYPLGRDHFFRNYAGGLRLKRYYYNRYIDKYSTPTVVDFTVGQNEYVTGGQLHRAVAHLGGSTPIAGIPGVYIYASFDLELSKNNYFAEPDPQFALQTAGSSITTASPNVAAIYVAQPDRDRYRFGVAVDFQTLLKIFPALKNFPSK